MASILVVDDNPDTCDVVSRLLRRAGHDVTCACSGEEALQLLGTFVPHGILLDHMMPGMSGIEVIRALRADRRFARTPIVLFTAMADDGTRDAAIAAGATDLWPKPLLAARLDSALAGLLVGVDGPRTGSDTDE